MLAQVSRICATMIAAMLMISTVHGQGQAVTINYGTVESVSTVEKDAKHAGGAMAGGMIAAIASGPRHKGLKIATSAAVGAAVQGDSDQRHLAAVYGRPGYGRYRADFHRTDGHSRR